MPNFGEQPTSTNRDRISGNEESAEEFKKQMAEANTAGDIDKVIELAGQAKSLKGQKEEFINKDQEDAMAENTEREEAKAKEKAAEELAAASENLKKQIAEAITAEDYTRAAELGGEMKELMAGSKEEKAEDSRKEAAQRKEMLEELLRKDKEDSKKKAEEILKKLNGEDTKDLESVSIESREMSPDVVYERFRGTTKYDKDGKIEGMYPALRNNAKFMLESFNKSRGNILDWASEQLMNDPTFLEQLKDAYAKKYGSGSNGMKDAEKYIRDITDSRDHKYDQVATEDVPDDLIENARKTAEKANKESGWEQDQTKEISQIESFLEWGKNIDEMEKKIGQAEQVFESQIGNLKSMEVGGVKRDAFLKLRDEVLKNGWGENYYTISERLDNPGGFKESTLSAKVDSMRYGLEKIDEANPVVGELSQKISDFEQRVKNITQREQDLLSKIQKARFESDPAFAK